jgi:hypothetical protein
MGADPGIALTFFAVFLLMPLATVFVPKPCARAGKPTQRRWSIPDALLGDHADAAGRG